MDVESGRRPTREHLFGMAFGSARIGIFEISPGQRMDAVHPSTTDLVDMTLEFVLGHRFEP